MVWQTEKGDGHTSPAPEAQCLSPLQRRTLAALIDAFMPPLDEAQTSQVLASANLRTERASFAEGFLAARGAQPCAVAAVEGAFALKLTAPERTEAKLLLSALSTRVGTALVLFASPLRPAFVDQPIAERERGLQFLARSPLGVHNKAFLGLKRLLLGTCLSAVDPEGNNAFWPAMGYHQQPVAAYNRVGH
ncbi:hypothetical protein T484DRAFT_1832073 [Baffinella frigidus]|nr:hypothetical protein T484DRAFT_1832073 [Cryptophyta sp. CCMP2293]